MPFLRRFGLLCLTSIAAAVLAGPVFAARPSGVALPNTVGTTHFLVHFQSGGAAGAATQTTAGQIAATAEHAYSAELADGYPAPLSDVAVDGDARIDIYISAALPGGALAVSVGDNVAAQTSGYIVLDGVNPEEAFTLHTIAHELFHLIQYGTWANGGASNSWLYEGTAEWMGYRTTGYDMTGGLELGPEDMSLDCSDPNGLAACDLTDAYANGGYSRWSFFEYLSERFGTSFVQDIFAQSASSGTAITGLVNALAAKGTTLADMYNGWSTANMSAGYSVKALQLYRPSALGPIAGGMKPATILSTSVAVNHLATEYIAFTKGNGDTSQPCFAATLSLTVAIPAGTLSKPTFFWDAKGTTPIPLTVNGNTASAAIPWDTCTWHDGQGYLSVPNASQAIDGADFGVTASVSVDTSKPVTSTPPPDLVALPGVISSPSSAVTPTIDVFGPELLTLSSTTQQLRLIVASSGEGTLQAHLGSLSLGSQPLRGGNNDLRFTIPKGALAALRRSTATSNVLTLTPTAPNGANAGPSVTRKISITTVGKSVKKAVKKAPATKAKAKKTPTKAKRLKK
jgi:hypothetical protein